MESRRILNWPILLVMFLAPLLVTGIGFLVALIQEQTRYNPDYFSQQYLDRYRLPRVLVEDLEHALQTGDAQMVAVLQGTHQAPARIEPQPDLVYSTLMGRDDEYLHFLFYDTVTFHRYSAYVKMERGRYILVPENLYYYMDSGRWTEVFVPPAVVWWGVLLVAALAVGIYRLLARIRRENFR